MNDRRQRILGRIAENAENAENAKWSTGWLCDVCMDITEMSGVGIMLMSGDVPLGSVGMTNEVSAFIEELQFTLGEGPCIDAYTLGIAIAEPDLAGATRRWPGFTPPALEAGVQAI